MNLRVSLVGTNIVMYSTYKVMLIILASLDRLSRSKISIKLLNQLETYNFRY